MLRLQAPWPLPPGEGWGGDQEAPNGGLTTAPPQSGSGVLDAASRAATYAILAEQERRRSPSYCLGAERTICGPPSDDRLFGNFGGPRTRDLCLATTSAVCLVVGVAVILALLALSVNALLRS